QNSGEEPRHTRGKKQTETQSCGAPRRHAIRTRNQVTDAALKSTAARFLFHFACAGTANIIHERGAQNASDPVLGDDAAQLMRGYAKQREIKRTEFSWKTLLLSGDSCQNGYTRQIKPEQRRVFREQQFLALLLFRSLRAVLLDRKVGFSFVRLCSLHKIKSKNSVRLRVIDGLESF